MARFMSKILYRVTAGKMAKLDIMKPIAVTSQSKRPQRRLSTAVLRRQNKRFLATGGRSQENRGAGFRPAFRDTHTGAVYLSCFANGCPAPIHLLDGLPADVVVARDGAGHVTAVKHTVIAGFVRAGRFYTRAQAAAAVTRH